MVEARSDDSIYNARSPLKGWNCVHCFCVLCLCEETVIIWLYMKCIYKPSCTFICRMIELDEAIEALDAAIEYKNDNISSKKLELRHSQILSQVRKFLRLNGD